MKFVFLRIEILIRFAENLKLFFVFQLVVKQLMASALAVFRITSYFSLRRLSDESHFIAHIKFRDQVSIFD